MLSQLSYTPTLVGKIFMSRAFARKKHKLNIVMTMLVSNVFYN